MFGERSHCDLSPFPSLLLSFLGVSLASLLWQMMTVQNPKKSWLAKKPACSLVDNVSLGLLLPTSSPSGSGCLSPEGDGLQPAISVPSFVLCVVLAVSYVQAFCVVAVPQSGLLAQVSSLWLHAGLSGLILTLSNAARISLPCPCLLVADAGVCAASPLGELPLGSQSVAFNYLFIFPPCYVALCASKACHRLSSECFLVLGNLSS